MSSLPDTSPEQTEDQRPPDDPQPADASQRNAILKNLDKTLFVDAGAGSGKTTALVGRVLALVESGIPMKRIAAITFTEKAAAELRDRIRRELDQCRTSSQDDKRAVGMPPVKPHLAAQALRELDSAAVSTLHSFAQRILAEHPTQAGLPPNVEVVDQIGSQIAFGDRWRRFAEKLVENPKAANSLLLLEWQGARLDKLREVAVQLNQNWDLIRRRIDLDAQPVDLRRLDTKAIRAKFSSAHGYLNSCHNFSDGVAQKLAAMTKIAPRLRSRSGAERSAAVSELLAQAKMPVKRGTASTTNWSCGINAVRRSIKQVKEECEAALTPLTQDALEYVVALLADETIKSAEQRKVEGCLEFHDLLVRARMLLRHPRRGIEVRRTLQQRYRRLLLDESQDTDPIQIELAVLIASSDYENSHKEWYEMKLEPGRLFFVGDAKQSIYRFRRADIGNYLRAGDYVAPRPDSKRPDDKRNEARDGERHSLTTNFRSSECIVDWVNDVFGKLIVQDSKRPDSQPPYESQRAWLGNLDAGPGVAVIGAKPLPKEVHADPVSGIRTTEPIKINAEMLREIEAMSVANTVERALQEGWQVRDNHGSNASTRPARAGDIAILIPARISLDALETALDKAAVSYRAETSTLVYGTREVRDLLLAAQAVSDPTDELALVATLRSALYGCGDDDLAHWKLACNGRFSLLSRVQRNLVDLRYGKPGYNHPVAEGIVHLRELHDQRWWLTPAQLLERIIRDRGALESAVATGRPRDVWRRLRFVVDQARAWSDAGGRGLRAFLEWARLQGADNARVTETVLPETDDDSVRILTIHGAKGLEFPITIVSGMSSQMGRRYYGPTVAFPPGEPAAVRVNAQVESEQFEDWRPIDEAMDKDERRRLLYVACTRARDHLVVSLHRKVTDKKTLAVELTGAGATRDAQHLDSEGNDQTQHEPSVDPSSVSGARQRALHEQQLNKREQWMAERDFAIAAASRQAAVSATALARHAAGVDSRAGDPGLDKDERDANRPWQKGRYGTQVGRAVHAALQTVELDTLDDSDDGGDIESVAKAQAMVEGVPKRWKLIEQLARVALATDIAREAASASWCSREMFVAAELEGQLVEGYIDLVYRTDAGLVIIDWKTDAVDNDDDLKEKLTRYRLQGGAYAAALEAATGEKVARMVFVFTSRDRAISAEVPDLRAAMTDATTAASVVAQQEDIAA